MSYLSIYLGLASSPEKDSPPAFEMVCLSILVNTKDFTLRVPESRLRELSDELNLWLSRERFTFKELQSLLCKLSFVTARVHASWIFLSRLLHSLRSFLSNATLLGGKLFFPFIMVFRLYSLPTGPLLIFVSPWTLV